MIWPLILILISLSVIFCLILADNQKWRFTMRDNKDRYLLFGCLYMAFTAIMSALVILNMQTKVYDVLMGTEWLWFPVILTAPIFLTAAGVLLKLLKK